MSRPAHMALAGIATALGVIILLANFSAIRLSIRERRHISPIPLVGGALGAVGVSLWPDPRLARWWWVPLALDPAGVAAVGLALATAAVQRLRSRQG